MLQDAWLTALQVHPSQHPCACVLYMDDGDDVLRTLAPSPRHDLHRVLMDPAQQLELKKGALRLLCMLCMLALTRAWVEACGIDACVARLLRPPAQAGRVAAATAARRAAAVVVLLSDRCGVEHVVSAASS